jgi:hypothetical protein
MSNALRLNLKMKNFSMGQNGHQGKQGRGKIGKMTGARFLRFKLKFRSKKN